ncbi:MAG TPA: S8 family serine peptidase, partial [Verrucomicrobiae bacterium]|nr:S8 family serine peptidase [Verrucomicrobiae bacterium]
MRGRVLIWLLLSGTLGVIVWRWLACDEELAGSKVSDSRKPAAAQNQSASDSCVLPQRAPPAHQVLSGKTQFRLSNTTRPLKELMSDPRAILLENALVDTRLPVQFDFPPNLKPDAGPGAYLVQSAHGLNDAFRDALSRQHAVWIAYIPNNACLVQIQGTAAEQLRADPNISAVLPYEPYYKLKTPLLQELLGGKDPGAPQDIRALLFENMSEETINELGRAGLELSAIESSPFGIVVRFACPPGHLAWVARLPGVQEIEPARARVAAVDLTRATLGIAADSIATSNYLGLTGSNVLVNVNDSGVDTNQPDLMGRVSWDIPSSGVDNDGHGTHVAGIVAGSGAQSLTVSNAPGSSMPPSA